MIRRGLCGHPGESLATPGMEYRLLGWCTVFGNGLLSANAMLSFCMLSHNSTPSRAYLRITARSQTDDDKTPSRNKHHNGKIEHDPLLHHCAVRGNAAARSARASLSSYSLATQGTSRVQTCAHATSRLKALVACAMRRKSIVGDLRSDALASINSPQAYCGGLFDMQSLSIPVGGTTRCTSYSCDPESDRLPNRSEKRCELYKTISPKPPILKARS